MSRISKTQKAKPTKKGLIARLFKNKKSAAKKSASKPSSSKKKAIASPKRMVKTPDKKKIAPKKNLQPIKVKKTLEKKSLPTPVKKPSSPPAKAPAIKPLIANPLPEPMREFVVESSYTPEPFRGSSFTPRQGKSLTAEGWKRLVEINPPQDT